MALPWDETHNGLQEVLVNLGLNQSSQVMSVVASRPGGSVSPRIPPLLQSERCDGLGSTPASGSVTQVSSRDTPWPHSFLAIWPRGRHLTSLNQSCSTENIRWWGLLRTSRSCHMLQSVGRVLGRSGGVM